MVASSERRYQPPLVASLNRKYSYCPPTARPLRSNCALDAPPTRISSMPLSVFAPAPPALSTRTLAWPLASPAMISLSVAELSSPRCVLKANVPPLPVKVSTLSVLKLLPSPSATVPVLPRVRWPTLLSPVISQVLSVSMVALVTLKKRPSIWALLRRKTASVPSMVAGSKVMLPARRESSTLKATSALPTYVLVRDCTRRMFPSPPRILVSLPSVMS
ncbi:hypothetical protein D3C73_1147670 [compost metagenome]